MNEAPKKIYMDVDRHWKSYLTEYPDDIPYIRADLVDELVAALEWLLSYSGIIEERDSNCATNKARAALKALETNNE